MLDVLVIGAGPAGLATALAVKAVRPDLKCVVCERARKLREVGASVGLLPNGQKVLAAILPGAQEALRGRGTVHSRSLNYDFTGTNLLSEEDLLAKYQGWESKYGYQVLSISWHEIQQALLGAIEDTPLVLEHAFASYEEDDEGVTVRFLNGSSLRTRLLIGADGNQSAVRRACLGEPVPEYTGQVLYRGLAQAPLKMMEIDPLGKTKVTFVQPGRRLGILMVPLPGARVALHAFGEAPQHWSPEAVRQIQSAPLTLNDSATPTNATVSSGQDAKVDRFIHMFGEGPSWVLDLVRDMPPGMLSENFEARRPAVTAWGKGRVTLVGDAAHLVPPMHAQGTSMAFEDAWQLGCSLKEYGLTSEALRHYETSRLPRIKKLQDYERANPRKYMEGEMLEYMFGHSFSPLRSEVSTL